jgi:hypothetical protein
MCFIRASLGIEILHHRWLKHVETIKYASFVKRPYQLLFFEMFWRFWEIRKFSWSTDIYGFLRIHQGVFSQHGNFWAIPSGKCNMALENHPALR